jgi:hypothetical protein
MKGVNMKYILLLIPLLFICCASEPDYRYDSIEQFLQEYIATQQVEEIIESEDSL